MIFSVCSKSLKHSVYCIFLADVSWNSLHFKCLMWSVATVLNSTVLQSLTTKGKQRFVMVICKLQVKKKWFI